MKLHPALVAIACCTLPVSAGSITFADVTEGQAMQSDVTGRIQLRASTFFGVGTSFFGVSGGVNPLALDDADGQIPADETLMLDLAEDVGLSGLDVKWTRAVVTLTGFTEDPQGSTGTYNAQTGTWSVTQAWTGDTTVRYQFSNIQASLGQSLTLSALDPAAPGCQISLTAVHFTQGNLHSPDATLLADTNTSMQVIDDFGASMFWTIDPTSLWPVETKEKLALKLMSEAGGIGLSNLRFDFGGGDIATGNQTTEPFVWRFPEAIKPNASAPYDWSRRGGQQWFLRRARDLAIENLTLASLSAPHWMTKSGRTFCTSTIGSTNLNPTQIDAYANYLTNIITHFRDNENITFDHVSPINEPEWDWESGSQEGDRATAADISNVVTALHAQLETAGLSSTTKILIGEHAQVNPLLDDSYHQQYSGGIWNGGNNAAGYGKYREYLKDLFNNPALSGKIEPVAAYHSYFTDDIPTLQSNLRSLAAQNAASRGVRLKQSEYCILGNYGNGRDLQFEPAQHVFRVIHKDLTVADVSAWSWWLALSPHDYKDGLIYTDFDQASDTNPRLFDSKIMWVLGNFSRFIRPGYRRLDSGGHDDLNGLMSSSWLSPDDKRAVIVAANFSNAPLVVNLPAQLSNQPGRFLSWDRWVTDRGRNLRQENSFESQTTLPPKSVTTFVGELSHTPFRLTVALSQSENNPLQVTATATYENGVFIIPTIHPSTQWVFQPTNSEPNGNLQNGRYFIRRMTDGMYLSIDNNDQFFYQGLRSQTSAWDVQNSSEGLNLTHPNTDRVLASNGSTVAIRRAGPSALAATRIDPSASYQWADNLGSEPVITFTQSVDRWVQVNARLGNDRASNRLRLDGQASIHRIGSMPAQIISRPRAAVTLRPALSETLKPFRFRLVPSDRDPVISSTSSANLSMTLPVGEDREQWELVEPAGGRVWLFPEAGRPCWIRSITSGLCLRPMNGALTQGTSVVQTLASGLESQWIFEAVDESRYRVRHPLSGLVLNISGTTGMPILWSDSTDVNSRFHLDPIDDDPLVLAWSHNLGGNPVQTVNPSSTTTYTVNAMRGGKMISTSTKVLVKETFTEWSSRWFGPGLLTSPEGDLDGDQRPELLEYALGSNPMSHDSADAGILQTDNNSDLRASWNKGVDALGEWSIEWSTDLVAWSALPNPSIVVEENSQQIAARIIDPTAGRIFIRLRFTPSISG